jgi:hypothetical protein
LLIAAGLIAGSQGVTMVILALLILFGSITCIGLYFIPFIIAHENHHRNAAPIFVINLFLGWTLLGWVGALAWSLTSQQRIS